MWNLMREDSQGSLPWVEKYRPRDMRDVIAQDETISTLSKLIDGGEMPHLLFYGPPGTGKTSTALAIARRLYGDCTAMMVLELNASDKRGIDIVRDNIKGFCSTAAINRKVKLVILDEADALTKEAQAALRRVMEKCSQTARFCLICNYVERITDAIQSRCTKFRFRPLAGAQIEARILHVATSEGIEVAPTAVEALVELCKGDMRDVLNTLQTAAMCTGAQALDGDSIYDIKSAPRPSDIQSVILAMLDKNFTEAYLVVDAVRKERMLAMNDLIGEVAKHTQRAALSSPVKSFLLVKLADLEWRCSMAANEEIIQGALVGSFTLAKDMIAKEMSDAGGQTAVSDETTVAASVI